MPLIQSAADALPHIDPPPSAEAIAAAHALIQADLAGEDQTVLHPSIPTYESRNFSDLVEAEHIRISSGHPKEAGIDLSRYEALDAPAKGDLAAWNTTLAKAYASLEYLHGREINLGLLETYGKNAWLIGNSQLEDILRDLEREVEGMKLELEEVEQERRQAQENVKDEMKSLEETWRKGVGRMIEAQAAAEGLKQQILERQRLGAS